MPSKRQPASGDRRATSCGVTASRATLDLTADEQSALRVMRCYFVSYARPQSVDWELGIDSAVKAFGEDRGPQVALRCLRAVQAMRVSRRTRFHFCDPFCPCCSQRLTANEVHLMRSIKAAGQGRAGEAKLAAMMLCEGNPDGDFLDAVGRLNAELSRCAGARARA